MRQLFTAILLLAAVVSVPLCGGNTQEKELQTMTAEERKGFASVKEYLNGIGRIESYEIVKKEGREVLVIRYRISPTPRSCIRIGISLPKHAVWTGKLIGLGNCGYPSGYEDEFYNWTAFAGSTGFSQHCLKYNNAVVTSDLGISRHQEKNMDVWKDFGFRATHWMTVTAKEVLRRYYGRSPERSYFLGLSTGGGQGFHEAQKFPEDYDGILAMVPACSRIQLWAKCLAFYRRTHDTTGKQIFSNAQMKVISDAALEYFRDKEAAYASGKFVTDPRYDREAAEAIARIAAEKDPSLAGELQKKIPALFEDVMIAGKKAASGVALGGADASSITNPEFSIFRWYYGKDFAPETYNADRDFPAMARELGLVFNAENPDMSAFRKRGGKLIFFAGTEDDIVPCSGPAWYYERAAEAAGGYDQLKEFCLYYQLPGRSHTGGRGILVPEHAEQALFDWCEKGIAPSALTCLAKDGTKYPVQPWPMRTDGDAKSGFRAVPVGNLPSVQPDPLYTGFMTAEQAAEEFASKGTPITYPEGKVSSWYGYRRHDFEIDGRKAFIVEPKKAAPGRPWTWCLQWPTAFVSRTPVLLLLKAGYHHVYIDIHDTRMNEEGIRVAKKFYDLLQSLYLNPKGALICLSIGGLYGFRWAAEYPETVSSIYADAPVTALACEGEVVPRIPEVRARYEKLYGVRGYKALLEHPKAPNNCCGILAKAKIPVYLLRHGEDQTVPCRGHSDIFIRNFRAAGGDIIVQDQSLYGHHPHGLDNPKPIADFILKNEY